jgi:hypothetical protein
MGMRSFSRVIVALLLVVLSTFACADKVADVPTSTPLPTSVPPTATATQTPVPPTATSTPTATQTPTATATQTPTSSPTPTPAPPTPTAMPTPVPQLQLDQVRTHLAGLPIDQFFEASYQQLRLRDPEMLTYDGLAEAYGVGNDRLTDRSDAYVRETRALEAMILDLLRGYDREVLAPEQQVSYDVYEWYLDDLVRGHAFMYYDYPVNSMSYYGDQN